MDQPYIAFKFIENGKMYWIYFIHNSTSVICKKDVHKNLLDSTFFRPWADNIMIA